jgi:hypothetical protein
MIGVSFEDRVLTEERKMTERGIRRSGPTAPAGHSLQVDVDPRVQAEAAGGDRPAVHTVDGSVETALIQFLVSL